MILNAQKIRLELFHIHAQAILDAAAERGEEFLHALGARGVSSSLTFLEYSDKAYLEISGFLPEEYFLSSLSPDVSCTDLTYLEEDYETLLGPVYIRLVVRGYLSEENRDLLKSIGRIRTFEETPSPRTYEALTCGD